ncbi:caspase family protein [Archangium violaceum]|uniref:hypothetical protein n=1 Tax=Archangium violaceum TaxID=83451 RepID=UPI002B308AEA|nr:caspase family protein [Archangium violaceum]
MRLLLFLSALLTVTAAAAAEPAPRTEGSRTAVFALIIGVNRSHEANLPTLRYADDDAARYLDLFRLLGARTYLLSRLDENTRRLHPQAAAEAVDPNREALTQAVGALAKDIALARERGVEAVAYVVYAGHGNVRHGEGYLSLEDGTLTGHALAREVVGRLSANRVHLIVDACYSYFLAYSRGPGGQRRALAKGFSETQGLAQDDNVGLLLSTSSARESHEWEAFQAGVFHHEVRSGLFGAADADGDGQVSYREIAAFVERANSAIPNERFRPQVHVRPPRGSELLVDLRPGLQRRLEVDEASGAHYVLEDANGVRLAEFHNAPGQPLNLLRPPPRGPTFLRKVGEEEREYPLPPVPDVVRVAELAPEPVRVASRGAAHTSFEHIFTLPFNAQAVAGYVYPQPSALELEVPQALSPRTKLGWTGLAVGGAALGSSLATILVARHTQESVTDDMPQQEVAVRNARIRSLNTAGTVLATAGGAVALGGALLLLWPEAETVPQLSMGPDGAVLGIAGAF